MEGPNSDAEKKDERQRLILGNFCFNGKRAKYCKVCINHKPIRKSIKDERLLHGLIYTRRSLFIYIDKEDDNYTLLPLH